jgi:hypothetical protein
MERGIMFMKMSSFFNHLNGKSKSRKLVPIDEEDVALDFEYAKTWRVFLRTLL